MGNSFLSDWDKVVKFQKEQLFALYNEEIEAGGYDNWYERLEPFRNYIVNKYISFHIFKNMYRPKKVVTDNGDVIDHHVISYLSPMDFTREGWGGKRLAAHQQIKELSDFFSAHGRRFVYVPLPNKGNIYPQLICDKYEVLRGGVSGNSPQWRKYVKEVLEDGVETLDMYPVFMKNRDENQLFSKEHHISAFGAEITGKAIANYLKETTYGIPECLKLDTQKVTFYCTDYGEPDRLSEPACVYSLKMNGRDTYYWNQCTEKSRLAIFGDCNLQSYCSHGAGISANLSHKLNYPVYNAGRKLIFGLMERPITKNELKQLLQYDIVIYVHFASAPFVRSAYMKLRHPALEYKWVNFSL